MDPSNRLRLTGALVLLVVAGVLGVRHWQAGRTPPESSFFYDLSESKLFTAPRTEVPPIRGLNDPQEDGVRAVVVSTNGNPHDVSARRIAYLEKYSPELRRQVLASRAGESAGAAEPGSISRVAAQDHILVARPGATEWFPVSSPEGEAIMTEWQIPGPEGITPVVCVP